MLKKIKYIKKIILILSVFYLFFTKFHFNVDISTKFYFDVYIYVEIVE